MTKEVTTTKQTSVSNVDISSVINEVIEYTKKHLTHEVRILRKHGYPERDCKEQEEEHKKIIGDVHSILKEFASSRTVMKPAMMSFLLDWLKNHIARTDNKYSKFLQSAGADAKERGEQRRKEQKRGIPTIEKRKTEERRKPSL